ncbi:MAG: cell wall-binding repeat-containing protein [Euzebyaceae bacterium]|nr:cell wall-binding repeat-containing protein [Euzebyaceae bacterium]
MNGTNCALYNGDPVSVNTINNGDPDRFDIPVSNPEAFVTNSRDADGNAPLDTEMDGLTIVLQCAADVNAGETNRMKLAIADTSDTIYDAAVFIRAGSLTTEPPPPEGPADRVAGATRVETAVEVSRLEFESATTVVLAREDTYPDALAGAPLARMEDAPILLTTTGGLHPAAAAEIDRLGATRAILLGGTAALDEQVEGDLQAMDVAAERIGGGNRFGTAQMIAESLTAQTGTPTAYVTEGEHADPARGWPDALAVSALAAFEGRPILLVNQGRLPGETAQAISDSEAAAIIVVGGLGAVSQEVEDAIAALGPETERTAGLTRYETARAIADRGIAAGMDPAISVLVSGEVFADALVAGPAVAKEGGVMMLSAQPTLDNSPPTRAYLEEFAGAVETLYVIGGTVAVSDEVVAEANAILAEG